MTIRFAQQRDVPGLIELLQQVGQVHHEIRPDIFRAGAQKYDAAALQQILSDSQRPIFVAVEEDFVLGYCFCVHKETLDNPVLSDATELYIDDLCVRQDCRGKGVAGGLFEYVKDYAKSSGCQNITLNVWCGNAPAEHFYEKMGMTKRNVTMELPL